MNIPPPPILLISGPSSSSVFLENIHEDYVSVLPGMAVQEGEQEEVEKKRKWDARRVLTLLRANWGILLFIFCWILLLVLGAQFLWEDLTWEAWYSLTIVCITLTLLIKDFFPPHFVLLMAMTSLLLAGVITPQEALRGFSNEGLITIAGLFVVAKAIEVNKAIDLVAKYLLRRPRHVWDAQLRLMVPVGLISAFMNNTPIVAMMIPLIQGWAQRATLPPSKLLIPLSYAAILGGTCTLIGTSTNLIVYDLARGVQPDLVLGFFEVGYVGLPVFVLGIIYVILLSPWLLPARDTGLHTYLDNPREYTLEAVVTPGSPSVGRTIDETGLNTVPGVSIFKIQRGEMVLMLPNSHVVLEANDVIIFTGIAEAMREVFTFEGIRPGTNQVGKIAGRIRNRCVVEVVIAPHSPLVGKSVRTATFRTRYNAAIIAVHRRGERLPDKVTEITFQAGDALLLEASTAFLKFHKHDQDFALVTMLSQTGLLKRKPVWKTIFTLLLTAFMVAISTAQVLPLVTSALLVTCVFLITSCVKMQEAFDAIKGDVLLLIACSFSLGLAMQKTGAASAIAATAIHILEPGGNITILFGLYALTALLSSIISNAATVTLMFPIAYEFVELKGLPFKAMVYTLMLAGSSCFATPIGYQTNLMVMGPGGYNFMDFVKFGLPMTVLLMGGSVGLCYAIFGM